MNIRGRVQGVPTGGTSMPHYGYFDAFLGCERPEFPRLAPWASCWVWWCYMVLCSVWAAFFSVLDRCSARGVASASVIVRRTCPSQTHLLCQPGVLGRLWSVCPLTLVCMPPPSPTAAAALFSLFLCRCRRKTGWARCWAPSRGRRTLPTKTSSGNAARSRSSTR